MIPLTIMYDGYIDRRKLIEQKMPVEYIVPPPLNWVGTINSTHFVLSLILKTAFNAFHRNFFFTKFAVKKKIFHRLSYIIFRLFLDP